MKVGPRRSRPSFNHLARTLRFSCFFNSVIPPDHHKTIQTFAHYSTRSGICSSHVRFNTSFFQCIFREACPLAKTVQVPYKQEEHLPTLRQKKVIRHGTFVHEFFIVEPPLEEKSNYEAPNFQRSLNCRVSLEFVPPPSRSNRHLFISQFNKVNTQLTTAKKNAAFTDYSIRHRLIRNVNNSQHHQHLQFPQIRKENLLSLNLSDNKPVHQH